MKYDVAEELRTRVGQIKKRFDHMICQDVAADEIGMLWYTNEKSPYKAKMIKTAEYAQALSVPTFVLVVWKKGWDDCKDEAKKDALILHELMHMGYDAESGKYSIRKHDVEDFKELINTIGISWENAKEKLELLENKKEKK